MASEIKYIKTPKGFIGKDDYSSHRELLWLVLENTSGEVLEIGCGFGSTRLLEAYCRIHGRNFISYENDIEWGKKFKLEWGTQIIWPEGFPTISLPTWEDIVFIDSKPGEQRKHLIHRFSNTAQVIIVHDTEPGAEYVYGMSEILSTFKYRIDYRPEGNPHTTAVSNSINIEEWINHPDLTSYSIQEEQKSINL